MLIKTIPVGQLEENCYVVTNEDTLECILIDPGDESNAILDYLEDNKLKCRMIMITHGHYDHVGAVNAICEELNIPVYINAKDDARECGEAFNAFYMPENGKHYSDGDVIEAAGYKFEIIETPGHTPGGVSIKCQDALFTGDTLFKGSCGRTDLEGGDQEEELRSLNKLCSLPGDYEVYPGHLSPSTLERERSFNHYCRTAMEKY